MLNVPVRALPLALALVASGVVAACMPGDLSELTIECREVQQIGGLTSFKCPAGFACTEFNPNRCSLECATVGNGVCDEVLGQCPGGTDQADCNPTSCSTANDGECDEPLGCAVGTDAVDCGGFVAVCGDGRIDPPEQCEGVDLAGQTCMSLGGDSGTLRCTSACQLDSSGCEFSEFADDFEDGFATGWQNGGWSIVSDGPSGRAARSGDIDNNQSSAIGVEVEFAPGRTHTIDFSARVSSEARYDNLYLEIDGERVFVVEASGWSSYSSSDISPGVRQVAFVYRKDGSNSQGDDAAYIDNVVMTGTVRP